MEYTFRGKVYSTLEDMYKDFRTRSDHLKPFFEDKLMKDYTTALENLILYRKYKSERIILNGVPYTSKSQVYDKTGVRYTDLVDYVNRNNDISLDEALSILYEQKLKGYICYGNMKFKSVRKACLYLGIKLNQYNYIKKKQPNLSKEEIIAYCMDKEMK